MVRIIHFQFILFLLSLLYFNCSSEMQGDFDKWISWNVKDYQKKIILESKWKVLSATEQGLDLKLRQAESKIVRITVNQNGTADFKTITEAINSIPLNNTRRYIVSIAPGTYREKITIPKKKPFITFLGDAMDRPTITGNDTKGMIGRDGTELKTFNTSTVAVEARYFIAININFENTARHDNASKEEQGVALRVSANKTAFYNCSFYGAQDTLYDHKGLHYFKNCLIKGTVDFIFGYGRSFYENCHIHSTTKTKAYITAQRRSMNTSMASGFSFKNSKVTGSGQTYLGRPWGNYSRVVFSYTYMDNTILPEGWSDWNHEHRYLNAYYGEYKCSGPGSNLSERVPWARNLTDQEAQPFLGTHFIEGNTWLISPSNSSSTYF